MWVCGLQRFYFLFVGLHSVFTWLSGYHFLCVGTLLGVSGSTCVLFVDHHGCG